MPLRVARFGFMPQLADLDAVGDRRGAHAAQQPTRSSSVMPISSALQLDAEGVLQLVGAMNMVWMT
jgi:hypothetical protein